MGLEEAWVQRRHRRGLLSCLPEKAQRRLPDLHRGARLPRPNSGSREVGKLRSFPSASLSLFPLRPEGSPASWSTARARAAPSGPSSSPAPSLAAEASSQHSPPAPAPTPATPHPERGNSPSLLTSRGEARPVPGRERWEAGQGPRASGRRRGPNACGQVSFRASWKALRTSGHGPRQASWPASPGLGQRDRAGPRLTGAPAPARMRPRLGYLLSSPCPGSKHFSSFFVHVHFFKKAAPRPPNPDKVKTQSILGGLHPP